MFGLIWGAIAGFFVAKDGIKGSIYDSNRKDQGELDYKNGNDVFGTYLDCRGYQRDVITDKRVFLDKEERTGDLILRDLKHKVIRNVSEEKRKRAVEQAKSKNDPLCTAAKIGYKDKINSYFDAGLRKHVFELQVFGTRYQDLDSGRIYVYRRFSWDKKDYPLTKICKTLNIDIEKEFPKGFCGSYFMDIESGLLVRISDEELQRDVEKKDRHERLGELYVPLDMDKYKKFMNIFNEYQEIMRTKYRWNKITIGNVHDYKSEREFNEYYFNTIKYL